MSSWDRKVVSFPWLQPPAYFGNSLMVNSNGRPCAWHCQNFALFKSPSIAANISAAEGSSCFLPLLGSLLPFFVNDDIKLQPINAGYCDDTTYSIGNDDLCCSLGEFLCRKPTWRSTFGSGPSTLFQAFKFRMAITLGSIPFNISKSLRTVMLTTGKKQQLGWMAVLIALLVN